MKVRNLLIVMLAGTSILLAGCPCKPPEEAKGPCQAPLLETSTQTFPAAGQRGNVIKLEKMAPTEVSVNQPFDYRIKVTNLTCRELNNVTVRDHVSENLVFKSSVPEMTRLEDGKVQWKLGTLGPSASRTISANAIAEDMGAITSCAEVFYDSVICSKINIVEPQLKLAKFAPSESLICDRIPLRYVVTNTGSGAACDITIEDSLSEGLMTSDGKSQLMFSLASLEAGQSHEFETMVDAKHAGRFASSAMAKSRAIGVAVQSNMTETIISQPVLTISETGPARQYIGRPLTYEITVTNTGSGEARDTVVEAMVPEEIDFDVATMGGSFSRSSPGRVVWNIGTLEPNESRKVSMTLIGQMATSFTTMSTAKAYCAEAVSVTAETVLSGISGILLEVVDVADPIEVGQSETYVITVTNQGSAKATNITISCMLQDTMEYISSTGPTTASVVGREITFAPLSSLEPKAQARWQLNVKAIGTGDSRFKATLNSDQLTSPVEETESTTSYEYE